MATAALGAAEGVAVRDCRTALWLAVAATIGVAVSVIVVRPFAVPARNVLAATLDWLLVVVALCAVLGATAVGAWLASITGVLTVAMVVLAVARVDPPQLESPPSEEGGQEQHKEDGETASDRALTIRVYRRR